MSRNIDIKKTEEIGLQTNYLSLSPEERSAKTAKLLERIDALRVRVKDNKDTK